MRKYLLGIIACLMSTALLAAALPSPTFRAGAASVPTPKQHELGGYETWLATNRLEPKASDKMLDALLEMAAEVCPIAAK